MPEQTKDFKLLAIRPRRGCHANYCKNLREEQLYQFCGMYQFDTIDERPFKITPNGNDHGLFNKYVHPDNHLKINVTAIVGKNGSGKSTITELLFLCCYLVGIKNGILKIESNKTGPKEQNQLKEIQSGLKVEVYYAISDKYYCMVIDNNKIVQQLSGGNISFIDLWSVKRIPMESFFYTIAINYSLYGLNESLTGAWVGRLFHKNDGYQTPVVINPFRDKGTINIVGEMHFAQTRMLSNLMLNREKKVEIIPGKEVTELVFIIDKAKLSHVDDYEISDIKKGLMLTTGKTSKAIFDQTYKVLLGVSVNEGSLDDERWKDWTIDYVVGKLIRIAMNYGEYKKFFTTVKGEGKTKIPSLHKIDDFLKVLKNDHTHITLKLRQALNFYRYDPLRVNDKRIKLKADRLYMPIDIFSERIKKNTLENPERDPMEFIPIAPFTPRLTLESNIQFHTLSSGEQQYINSVQSVIYHILNLNSVFNNNYQSTKVTYDCINIILDEIELYFHPEFQRMFVKDLLQTISKLDIPNISGINLLFLTHSPFILSDIPAANVLRIKNGHAEKDNTPTFAGNIHQMLATSFFMDSTTGDFAREQYQDIMRFYEEVKSSKDYQQQELIARYRQNREKFEFIVSQIGEDVIKGVMNNHLAYLDDSLLKKQFTQAGQRKDIEIQIELLNQQLKDLDDQNQLP